VSADRFRRAGTDRASRVSTSASRRSSSTIRPGFARTTTSGFASGSAASVVDFESTETEAEANGEAKASERGVIVGASAARRGSTSRVIERTEGKNQRKGRLHRIRVTGRNSTAVISSRHSARSDGFYPITSHE